ncbi:hypothetical protein WA026_020167 [Henosepilachna vigintioctopunctata]|uniref:Autophagy-related protein 13 n=1 Tax=Henosepilachna vigintioctopunctata TaxID=420089 RepID=A0AAW1U2A6_9CUCU
MMKLSEEIRNEMFKYIRHFTLKAAQIIISSRSGEKVSTPCTAKLDWFNLNISDSGGLLATLKKTISNKVIYGTPFCVEIFLQTPEGEKMVLETWCIFLSPEYCEPNASIASDVYKQMGKILKSLISLTKIYPAYGQSQKQDSQFYTISYRMYEKEPELHALGEKCEQKVFNPICTPVGTLQLSLVYRVKMAITPTHSSHQENTSVIVKNDHFSRNICRVLSGQEEELEHRRKYPIRAAFADPRPEKTDEPAASLKKGGVLCNIGAIIEEQNRNNVNIRESISNNINSNESENVDETIVKDLEEVNISMEHPNGSWKSTSSENQNVIVKLARQTSQRIGKPVQYPFATPTPESELLNFYRECAHAPMLVSLPETTASNKNIAELLVAFEVKEKEFDDMVKSLCESPDNDN